jgi:hypothetical protein
MYCCGLKDEAPTDFVYSSYSSTPDSQSNYFDLSFYVPLSALAPIYPIGGFPFENKDHRSWREPFHDWLASIGSAVLKRLPNLPMRCAGISFEGLDFSIDRLPVDFPISDPPRERGGAYLCVRRGEFFIFRPLSLATSSIDEPFPNPRN